jgi:hypothetical protein
MLREWVRKQLNKWLDDPHPKAVLARTLIEARRSLDHLTPAVTNPSFDFERQRSSYPKLAAHFMKMMRESDTHPHYAWGSLQGVHLAKAIGVPRVSLIEFGVASGKGLIALDGIATALEKLYGVTIDVYGFDSGGGLPPVTDYRDLPNLWSEGDYPMDRDRLLQQLKKARLVLGNVMDTIPSFLDTTPAPVAFVSFDLDLYTSTTAALRLFDAGPAVLLPRVHCYFDDIMGFTTGEHNGERLAIHEFNESHQTRKVSQIHGLKYFIPEPFAHEIWVEMMFIAHMFDHPSYAANDGLVRGSASIDPADRSPHWSRLAR